MLVEPFNNESAKLCASASASFPPFPAPYRPSPPPPPPGKAPSFAPRPVHREGPLYAGREWIERWRVGEEQTEHTHSRDAALRYSMTTVQCRHAGLCTRPLPLVAATQRRRLDERKKEVLLLQPG